jgi:hypothetical protein
MEDRHSFVIRIETDIVPVARSVRESGLSFDDVRQDRLDPEEFTVFVSGPAINFQKFIAHDSKIQDRSPSLYSPV